MKKLLSGLLWGIGLLFMLLGLRWLIGVCRYIGYGLVRRGGAQLADWGFRRLLFHGWAVGLAWRLAQGAGVSLCRGDHTG